MQQCQRIRVHGKAQFAGHHVHGLAEAVAQGVAGGVDRVVQEGAVVEDGARVEPDHDPAAAAVLAGVGAVMAEDVHRVLHADVNYRIGVCGSGNLPSIRFKVYDVRDNNKLIYDNSEHDFDWKWDVKMEASRQLRIVVTVPVGDENTTSPEEGCVSVMIGSTDY